MIQPVNLINELAKQRREEQEQNTLLNRAKFILNNDFQSEQEVLHRLMDQGIRPQQQVKKEFLERDLIFNENTIKKVCTKYRLRFLNAPLFVGDIPREALQKVKNIEQECDVKIERFKILAPASRFRLKDAREDPVLMADLGNGTYYLIHKWGDDMSASRSFINYPLRNVTALAVTALVFGVLTVMLLPESVFPEAAWDSAYKMGLTKIYSGFILTGFFFVGSLIFGILASKEFSEDVWNSKFFN